MKLLTAQEFDDIRKKVFYIVVDSNLKVEVKVTEHKVVYGRNRFLITPISGTGEVWKNSDKVFDKEQ